MSVKIHDYNTRRLRLHNKNKINRKVFKYFFIGFIVYLFINLNTYSLYYCQHMPYEKEIDPTIFLLTTDTSYYNDNQAREEGRDGLFVTLKNSSFWYSFGVFRIQYEDRTYIFEKEGEIIYLTTNSQFEEPVPPNERDKWQKQMMDDYHHLSKSTRQSQVLTYRNFIIYILKFGLHAK